MEAGHLGNLGGLGMPVLEIKQLHALLLCVWEEIGEGDKCLALIRKNFQVVSWTSCASVHADHFGEDYL